MSNVPVVLIDYRHCIVPLFAKFNRDLVLARARVVVLVHGFSCTFRNRIGNGGVP